jgi:transposase
VYRTVKKYQNGGIEWALRDEQRSGRPTTYNDAIRAAIINTACQSPKTLGLSQELRTISSLTNYINEHVVDAEGNTLRVSRSSVGRTLSEADIKPHKIKYYCEKRDPDFERKMNDLLIIYKQVQLQLDDQGDILCADEDATVTLSYDEKPGIQAIANTSADRMPQAGGGSVMRDYEYRRLGTVSLLAAIDLLSGKATPLVRDTHKSSDFVDFLKILDAEYPPGQTLRIILDNHSVHKSAETRAYLESVHEGRFVIVFTPKHGSWLNLIESLFSKMTRQALRGIRVDSKQELVDRIYKYFEEINAHPVVFRWKYRLDEITL